MVSPHPKTPMIGPFKHSRLFEVPQPAAFRSSYLYDLSATSMPSADTEPGSFTLHESGASPPSP